MFRVLLLGSIQLLLTKCSSKALAGILRGVSDYLLGNTYKLAASDSGGILGGSRGVISSSRGWALSKSCFQYLGATSAN
jgi:hypothetical protein